MYDIVIYGLAILWGFSALMAALNGVLSLCNFERGSRKWKIGVLQLCRVPFDVLIVLLLLYLYRNEFDSTWTLFLPSILLVLVIGAYAAIRAGITHGGLRKGVAIEANSFFSDLVKDKVE